MGEVSSIEQSGTPDRKWCCVNCANLVQRQQAKNALGKEALEISRIFDADFLKD